MLAQNFKSHKELKIPRRYRDALIVVLNMMERGEVRHVPLDPTRDYAGFDCSWPPMDGFNMLLWGSSVPACGTVGCIRGYVSGVLGANADSGITPGISDLYVPRCLEDSDGCIEPGLLSSISVEQAAAALRSYLTTGDANWREILYA